MKKLIIAIVLLVLAGFVVFKFFFSKADKRPDEPKQQALSISKNSPAFNESFEKILNSYFALKAAITDYDTAKANAVSKELAVFADSLKTAEIKGDSTGDIQKLADNFSGTISGSAKGLAGETDFIKKKREFQMISDALYNLTRTVKYDRQKLYHQHCPMAFNDEEEAWWISNDHKIENPYLGRKHPKYKGTMIECGDITDSLDFSKK
jgi:Protein of unknown function (DUF3347)